MDSILSEGVKMISRNIDFSSAALLTAGLLLGVLGVQAQVQGSMPGTPQAVTSSSQNLAQRSFAGAMLSSLRAQTKFSKIALKNSSDEEVKQMAKHTISDNQKLDAELSSLIAGYSLSYDDLYNFGRPTAETREVGKRMKSLKGRDFDRAFLSEMDTYIQNDRKRIQDNSRIMDPSLKKRLGLRLQTMSDRHMQQLQQAAQSENLKLQSAG